MTMGCPLVLEGGKVEDGSMGEFVVELGVVVLSWVTPRRILWSLEARMRAAKASSCGVAFRHANVLCASIDTSQAIAVTPLVSPWYFANLTRKGWWCRVLK